jgi:glycosyltransferase involved in cell wall biosynthesis
VRICHVAPELLPVPPRKGGAIERWIRDAARILAGRGHDVHVVSRDHGDRTRETSLDGVHYHFVRMPKAVDRGRRAAFFRGLWYFGAASRLVAHLQPDIVHHHSRPAGLYLSSAYTPGSRSVISLHSMQYGWHFGYAAWDRIMFGHAFRRSARVLCVSDFIRRHTLELYPDLAGKALTVYNGVDARTFHPDPVDKRLDGETREPIILYVGRVEERKGVHLLLDAFERVIRKRACGARLRIVGPASYWTAEPTPYYVRLADRCRTIPGVELRGATYVDLELADLYRSATISVVPSVVSEALGLTSLEAQASGVPTIVSSAGGLPETILPGETGVVFENGDVEGLASSVLGLLGNSQRLRVMGVNARAWVMRRFSWDLIASELETIYAQVLA